jgi:hypothetical protein
MRVRYVRDLHRTIAKAISQGGKAHSLFRYSWDVSSNCENPQTMEIYGRQYADREYTRPLQSRMLTMTVRCRRCGNCLRKRSKAWEIRAVTEYSRAHRTWFGTLTLSPENHFLNEVKTRKRLAGAGTKFDDLSEDERFAEATKTTAREITLYLKRIRKESGSKFTYLLVTEAHKSGLPHYHMLLHEIDPDKAVRYRTLSHQWTLGFEQWRLLGEQQSTACAYVAKYLSKSKLARVRASLHYGRERGSSAQSHLSGSGPRPA